MSTVKSTEYRQFVPLITSVVGAALTMKSWQQLGFDTLAASLEDLLIRPGFSVLCNQKKPEDFFGWENRLIIDATSISMSNSKCRLRAPHSGEMIEITDEQLNILSERFKNNIWVMPGVTSPYWISDMPMSDAVMGIVYTQDKSLDISQLHYQQQHKVLMDNCLCPTCQKGFTKAYLHHLLEHTPLLAQRYLIQHNVNFVSIR